MRKILITGAVLFAAVQAYQLHDEWLGLQLENALIIGYERGYSDRENEYYTQVAEIAKEIHR